MNMFDKRIELLEGLALVVKLKDKTISKEEAENIDFVEYNDFPYINELLEKINVKKYPELTSYILDINDCSWYTELYLYFDNEFNYKGNCNLEIFGSKNIDDFAKLVKKIYDAENIDQIFVKYSPFLTKISRVYNDLYKFDKQKVREEYSLLFDVPEDVTFDSKITILANGGFSSSKDNKLSCVKGIGACLEALEEKKEFIIIVIYHEFAHYFVNPKVDKNLNNIPNKELLLQEAIAHGLPVPYQSIKALLYEYFVRALSIIYTKGKVNSNEITEAIEYFKKIGFVRVEDIIAIIENGMKNNKSFEDILKTDLCKYFASVDKNFGSSQRSRN